MTIVLGENLFVARVWHLLQRPAAGASLTLQDNS